MTMLLKTRDIKFDKWYIHLIQLNIFLAFLFDKIKYIFIILYIAKKKTILFYLQIILSLLCESSVYMQYDTKFKAINIFMIKWYEKLFDRRLKVQDIRSICAIIVIVSHLPQLFQT